MAISEEPGPIERVLSFWRLKEGVIQSPLSIQACRERLKAETEGPLVLFGPRPMRGMIGRDWARLRKNIRLNNSFQTLLLLSLESTGGGTRLTWRCGASTVGRLFTTAWLVGIVVVVTLGLGSGAMDLLFLGPAALVMLAIGGGLAAFGRRMARGEDQFLLETVTALVEGHASTR
jgi:hypothetical protein